MKRRINLAGKFYLYGLALVLAVFWLAAGTGRGCTIFVLTDTNRALFCNNEDWSNPKTRIWFMPASEGCYGVACVGFDDGYAQGELNTEGLACDWVAGYNEKWTPDPKLPTARRSSSQRMMESCTTVEEAIAFYKTHREPGFRRAKILVADRTGASAMIGAKDGKLQVERQNTCRGFGYGRVTLDKALAENPEPTVGDGFKILRACRQGGEFATKYSNVYDMKTGDIFLYPFPERDDEVKLNLTAELKKGAHYYDMDRIKEELTEAPRALLPNMARFPMDAFKAIPDKEPKVTARIRGMLQDAAAGEPREADYTPKMWQEVSTLREKIQGDIKKLGGFDSLTMTLVERGEFEGKPSYRYRIAFGNMTVIQHYVLDEQGRLAAAETELQEAKPGAEGLDEPPAQVAGIGVVLDLKDGYLVIMNTIPGSPAAKEKKIHVGDRIIAVAQDKGPAVKSESGKLAQIVPMIRGAVGTTVRLTIASPGEEDSQGRVVSLVRAEVKVPTE